MTPPDGEKYTEIIAVKEFQIVAENRLPGEVFATPAILRNFILMRVEGRLYRIE